VLELSRLERQERPVQMVVGDVGVVVREVAEVFRTHAEREGFRLEVQCAAGLPAARFDRDALTQVLFNLLDNALKYGRGERERWIGVCVSDWGPGVLERQLESIFEPFYRGQSELTRTQQGTGIGLALVRGLVQRMRGQVRGQNLSPGFEVQVTLESG
jgi:signal transduction histidine kinase